jgi:hypothetical protein
VRFRGVDLEHVWRIAFWVILILAALASAGHALAG